MDGKPWYSVLLRPFRRYWAKQVTQTHRRFFEWYCNTFCDLRQGLLDVEWEYLQTCFGMAERFAQKSDSSDYEEYSYYTYSHRIKGEQVNSSRFAFGSVLRPQEALHAARPVFEKRDLKIPGYFLEDPNCHFYGLGWDLEEHQFKVYFRILDLAQIPFASLQELLDTAMPEDKRRKEGLVSFTYIEREIYEEKVYVYPRAETQKYQDLFPGAKGRVLMATSQRGLITQYDVSTTRVWRDKLNAVGQKIVDTYARQGYTLDTIAFKDAEDCTLYFPGAFYPFLSSISKIKQHWSLDSKAGQE